MARRTEPVQADRSYTMLQLCEAAGVNPTVVRAAVRTGLKFTKVARGRQYTGKAWIVDFDKCGFRTGDEWKAGNLARLQRSLHKLFGARSEAVDARAGWQQLLAAHASVAG